MMTPHAKAQQGLNLIYEAMKRCSIFFANIQTACPMLRLPEHLASKWDTSGDMGTTPRKPSFTNL